MTPVLAPFKPAPARARIRLTGSVAAAGALLTAMGTPARVSLGSGLTRAAMAYVRRVAEEVVGRGTFDALRGAVGYDEANAWFIDAAQPTDHAPTPA